MNTLRKIANILIRVVLAFALTVLVDEMDLAYTHFKGGIITMFRDNLEYIFIAIYAGMVWIPFKKKVKFYL